MNAFDQADRDEQAGEFGTARRRLLSRFATVGYSPELCERIARLSIRMGDPVEAGRWYYLCNSSDPESGPAIDRFRASCGGLPLQMNSQLPAKVRDVPRHRFPPEVRARLEPLGPPPRPTRARKRTPMLDHLVWAGCAVSLLLLLLATGIGGMVMARWLIRLVT